MVCQVSRHLNGLLGLIDKLQSSRYYDWCYTTFQAEAAETAEAAAEAAECSVVAARGSEVSTRVFLFFKDRNELWNVDTTSIENFKTRGTTARKTTDEHFPDLGDRNPDAAFRNGPFTFFFFGEYCSMASK